MIKVIAVTQVFPDYTILYYDVERGHRLQASAVLVNPTTGRFVVYMEISN